MTRYSFLALLAGLVGGALGLKPEPEPEVIKGPSPLEEALPALSIWRSASEFNRYRFGVDRAFEPREPTPRDEKNVKLCSELALELGRVYRELPDGRVFYVPQTLQGCGKPVLVPGLKASGCGTKEFGFTSAVLDKQELKGRLIAMRDMETDDWFNPNAPTGKFRFLLGMTPQQRLEMLAELDVMP